MFYRLGKRSERKLSTVVAPLQQVVRLAITLTDVDFSVVEGIRTFQRQKFLYNKGLSWTLESRHLVGKAVDIYPWVDGKTSHDPEDYKRVAKAMFDAAQWLGIPLTWGGFWYEENLDRPHWELQTIKPDFLG